MKTISLINKLAKRFPKRLRSSGDRGGLMTGKLKEETKVIALALDFDDDAFEAIKKLPKKPDLILTHHPFIYGTKYRVFKGDKVKEDLCRRIDEYDIPVYSMHTNFDTGKDGMNDALAEALGLVDIKPLDTCSMARGGRLPEPMEIHEFAKFAIKQFKLPYAELIHRGTDTIKTVAILGGAGSYKSRNSRLEGYDIFISGDAPHHMRREIVNYKYNYLNVLHEVEKIFMPQMEKIIHEMDPSIEIYQIDQEEFPELIK